jgi:hypothetical protein
LSTSAASTFWSWKMPISRMAFERRVDRKIGESLGGTFGLRPQDRVTEAHNGFRSHGTVKTLLRKMPTHHYMVLEVTGRPRREFVCPEGF